LLRRLRLPALLFLVLRINQKRATHNPAQVNVNETKPLVNKLRQHSLSFHNAKKLFKDASPVVNNKDASFFKERTFESPL
jgi:hypothetical protein